MRRWQDRCDARLAPSSAQRRSRSVPALSSATPAARVSPVTGLPDRGGARVLGAAFRVRWAIKVALHVEPVAPADAAQRLRRQRARFESSRRLGGAKGSLSDPSSRGSRGR